MTCVAMIAFVFDTRSSSTRAHDRASVDTSDATSPTSSIRTRWDGRGDAPGRPGDLRERMLSSMRATCRICLALLVSLITETPPKGVTDMKEAGTCAPIWARMTRSAFCLR